MLSLAPARIWYKLAPERRLQAATTFWTDEEGLEQQVEAMVLLARHLKARPRFVQSQPVEKRSRYLASYPGMPDALAARLLVSYHLGHQRPMLKAFLDALGIAHEEGLITSDPEGPIPTERLRAAVAALDESFPREDVTLYLATLLSQDPETWKAIEELDRE